MYNTKKYPMFLTLLFVGLMTATAYAVPTWSLGSPFSIDPTSTLGNGSITQVVNPIPAPDDNSQEADSSDGFSFQFMKEEPVAGAVKISFSFIHSGADTYKLQYVDSDYYAADDKWTTLQEFTAPQGSHIDTTYGVNAKRYYRIIGVFNGEIVYWSPIKGVLFDQEYKTITEKESYSITMIYDDFGFGIELHRSPTSKVTSEGKSTSYSLGNLYHEEYKHEHNADPDYTTSVSSVYIKPIYSWGLARDIYLIKTEESGNGGFDTGIDKGSSSISTVSLKDNNARTFDSGKSITNYTLENMPPEAEDGSNAWSESVRIMPFGYRFDFYDFRGKLDIREALILAPGEYAKASIGHSPVTAGSWDYDYFDEVAKKSDTRKPSKIIVSWDNTHLRVRGINPDNNKSEWLHSPIETDEGYDSDWTIELLKSRNGRSSEMKFRAYLPNGSLMFEESKKIVTKIDGGKKPVHDYFSIPVNDATGPRYRKIALNGRPLSDERPQDSSENDEAKEETYIDAFNLNLVHSVTDIYFPVPGSDLSLSIRRNLRSEIFSENGGLRPDEDPAKPFGACWSSNVSSYVKVVTPEGPDVNGYEEPVTAYVIDENGNTHEFYKYKVTQYDPGIWFPMPSASHEAKAYLTSLEENEGGFIFKQKYGNCLYFEKLATEQTISRDRVEGSENNEVISYARLTVVTDRLGYQLAYHYNIDDSTGETGLIPYLIQAHVGGNADTLGDVIPGLQIWLSQSGNHVTEAWDPNGNAITYNYDAEESGEELTYSVYVIDPLTSVGSTETVNAVTLDEVVHADNGTTTYTYETAVEFDSVPRNPGDVSWPYADPEVNASDSLSQHIDYVHINLKTIADANSHLYSFDYDFDHSVETYLSNPVAEGYFVQNGRPRYVRLVSLPIGSASFTLTNNVLGNRMRIGQGIVYDANGSATYGDLAITESKTNIVHDALGHQTTYNFKDIKIEIMKQFKDLFYGASLDAKFKDPRILYYKTMVIDHGEYGNEVYTFNPSAGLALSTATDLSGNKRTYTYTDKVFETVDRPEIWPVVYGYFDDPRTETITTTENVNFHKYYTYYNDKEENFYRKMHTATDIKGRVTSYLYSTDTPYVGQLKTVSENDGSRVTTYEYDWVNWPGFVTKETVTNGTHRGGAYADIVTNHTADDQGRVAITTINPGVDANGVAVSALETTTLYDFNGNQRLVTDPEAHVTGFTYDERNRLTRVTHHDDTYVNYTYDKRGNLVLQRDENDNLTGNEYDALNRRIKTVRSLTGALSFDFDGLTLTGIGADDIVTTQEYNAVNSLLLTSMSDGPTTRFEYDGLQRLKVQKQLMADNPLLTSDIISTFDYGKNSGGSAFDVTSFKPTVSVGPRGYKTSVEYDGLYRPISTTVEYERGKFATSYTAYDLTNNTITETDPFGRITVTQLDGLDRPINVLLPDGTEISTDYTPAGLTWKSTISKNSNSQATTTDYDNAGRPIKAIQPLVPIFGGADASPVTKTFYDGAGNVTKTINPNGEKWEFEYDVRNRKVIEKQPFVDYITEAGTAAGSQLQPTSEMTYDDVGNVISVEDPRGNISVTQYDAANRPEYTFTALTDYWNGSSTVTGKYLATQSVYDRASKVMEVWQGYATTQDSSTFTGVRQSADNTYDALGRLLTATDAESITVTNTYDADGNLLSVKDGEDHVSTFTYDGLGRNLTTTYGGTDTTQMIYDALRLVSRVDANGKRTTYEYDQRDRLLKVLYQGASAENRAYSYDDFGNILSVTEPGKGGLTDVAYTYDDLNRIITEESGGIAHEYQYDLSGNRRQTIYDLGGANERTLVSTYDELNRTKTIFEDDDGDAEWDSGERITTYSYDIAGNIRETAQPNGDVIKSTYDKLGRKQVITGPGASSSEIYVTTNAYDLYSNLAHISESYPGGDLKARTITNAYDGANRLLTETIVKHVNNLLSSATDETVVTAYSYDNAHNRTSKVVTVDGVTTTSNLSYVFSNSLNQIDSFTDSISGKVVTFDYDNNGNRISQTVDTEGDTTIDLSTSYVYDRENRLVKLTEADGTAPTIGLIDIYPGVDTTHTAYRVQASYTLGAPDRTYVYAYDYRTRRVLRDESGASGASTQVIFSGGLSVQEYDDAASSPTVEYIRGSDYGGGIGGILYTLRSGTPSFKHYNSRGDIVAATDASSDVTYQAAYEAFGRHGDTNSSQEEGSTLDRQKANTKDEDPTGLLNEGFRYRDLESGVFLTRDPLGFVDGPNMYTYVVQNPWTKFDPKGLRRDDGKWWLKDEQDSKGNWSKDLDENAIDETFRFENGFTGKNSEKQFESAKNSIYGAIKQVASTEIGERLLKDFKTSFQNDFTTTLGKGIGGSEYLPARSKVLGMQPGIRIDFNDVGNHYINSIAKNGDTVFTKSGATLDELLFHEAAHVYNSSSQDQRYSATHKNYSMYSESEMLTVDRTNNYRKQKGRGTEDLRGHYIRAIQFGYQTSDQYRAEGGRPFMEYGSKEQYNQIMSLGREQSKNYGVDFSYIQLPKN